jgi:hypothetical protein
MNRFSVLVAVASVVFAGAIGCSHQSERPVDTTVSHPALDETATAVRLQATIYELRVPPAAIGALDAAMLAKADFAKPLPDIGEARALYRVDQRVSLTGDRIMVGSDEPTVTNTRMTDRGQRINSVQYSSVGAIVEFKAERTGPRELRVTSTIEMSTRTESPVKIADTVSSPVTRKAMLSLKGPVEVDEPSVLISADAASLDKDGKAVVYVARLVVGA